MSGSTFFTHSFVLCNEDALYKEVGGKQFDPLGLGKLGTPDRGFDTFPDMFPHPQYLADAELKNGRMAMLAWTGVWATTKVSVAVCRNSERISGLS